MAQVGVKQPCKSCKYFNVGKPDKDGKVRIRRNYLYECTFKVEWPDLPSSMIGAYGFQLPNIGHCFSDKGQDCSVYERLNL